MPFVPFQTSLPVLHLESATSSNSGGGGFGFLIFAALAIGALYLLTNRAGKRRKAYSESLQNAAHVGAQVMMTSGIYGTVVEEQGDDTVLVSIAPGVEVRFAKAAIARVIVPEEPPAADEENPPSAD